MLNSLICELCDYAVKNNLITELDKTYCINRVIALVGANSFEYAQPTKHDSLESLLDDILDIANENGALEQNTGTYRDILSAKIMNCFVPFPTTIVDTFDALYAQSPEKATDYYYALSKATNYIMTDRVAKNIVWNAPTRYGDLVMTINLSKPEKDPKEIAKAKNTPSSGYPKCALCYENEGFEGNLNQAPRANHRIIPITLAGQDWFFQYSPYVYYNEHCILLNKEHKPMQINRECFDKLTAFVEKFPHYFVGSNADLPIVGGSILSHDHFQGGRFEFPMAKSPIRQKVSFKGYEDVDAGIVDWALSTIRLRGKNRERLCELADKILTAWRGYTDEQNEIFAHTDAPHNTITPIARVKDGHFELDLILRNNRQSDEHPLGIFHPHAQYHNIKKENIGLIEAMGLAVLPARLKTELAKLAEAMDSGVDVLDESVSLHQNFYNEIRTDKPNGADTLEYIYQRVGQVFGKILENCAVFKDTPQGQDGFVKFVESVVI